MRVEDRGIVRPRAAPAETLSSAGDDSREEQRTRRFEVVTHTGALVRRREVIRPRPSPRLRVAFVTPNLLMGGVEHWLLGLLKHNTGGLDWTVVVTNPHAVEPEMRLEAEQYANVMIGESAIVTVAAQSDVVIAWGVFGLDRWLREFRGPVVQVSHGSGAWTESFLTANRGVETQAVAVSREAATAFAHGRVTVIPNGVDPQRCESLRPREVVRLEWGLRPDEIAVGFVGRISPEKNPLATSRAVRALGPGYRAVYVGKGYGEDMRPAARDLTPDAIFVPPVSQVGDALHALDCLIMASPAEGFSLVLIESLMAALPVVATPVGVVPDLEQDYGLKLITVPVHPTPDQLAEAVRRAIAPENRNLTATARQIAESHYSAKTMSRRWASCLVSFSSSLFSFPSSRLGTDSIKLSLGVRN